MDANGYAWWYIDATSDDGAHALTLIAFVGSVFSPYYAKARADGLARPDDFVASNVCLYGPRSRWALNEHHRGHVEREHDMLRIARTSWAWTGSSLDVSLYETTTPLRQRVIGTVRLIPEIVHERTYVLDGNGRHLWRPVAPRARVEVDFQSPRFSWRGRGYHDVNMGTEPLEHGFTRWSWSRVSDARSTVVTYDVMPQTDESVALRFSGQNVERITMPAVKKLSASRWGVARDVHCDAGHAPRLAAAFEDTPFYNRSLVETRCGGVSGLAMHESVDLTRFVQPWVQFLLPFRMQRHARMQRNA
ncbi:MAG: carotenoid 1,2-hydratase [Clostridia bacterium]|nr:carotenoid 1,2-hydratase [Deltaproteobacteria bacterium]